jgi:hypothetical protein
MMPQLISMRIRRPHGRVIRIWIPIIPVLLLLSPLLILGALVAGVVCLAYRVNPLRAFGTGWRVLWAMSGTRVDVEQGNTAVLVNIR